jgi:hypothetical protein
MRTPIHLNRIKDKITYYNILYRIIIFYLPREMTSCCGGRLSKSSVVKRSRTFLFDNTYQAVKAFLSFDLKGC